jgi:hypothetical protein
MSTYIECIAIHRRAWYQKLQPTIVVFLCVIILHRLATNRLWALSAVGSACDSHSQGQAFDSPSVHVILLIFLLNLCGRLLRLADSELDRPQVVPRFAFATVHGTATQRCHKPCTEPQVHASMPLIFARSRQMDTVFSYFYTYFAG